MILAEALRLFIVCTLLVAFLGGFSDWANRRSGERLYKFPSRKSYLGSFVVVLAVYMVSFWLAFLVLQLV
jgi:hypothetical protein